MLDVLDTYAGATDRAGQPSPSGPPSLDTRQPNLLLVEPDRVHLPDRAAFLAQAARDEALLIEATLAGDPSRYKDLIRPYECRVYTLALLYMKTEIDAEDLTQSVFVRALHQLASLGEKTRFSALLVRLTLEEAQHRKRG